jgi:hypothetical protein
MKKYLLLISLLTGTAVYAQIPEDAIRYSFFPQTGTARNMAIGGAMGSLGGDINATFVNPAGLGFYRTGELVISPALRFTNNKFNYRETTNKNKNDAFGIGTTGIVAGYTNRYNNKISNAVSLVFTQTANFNNKISYNGLNNFSSFGEQFAEEFAKSGYSIDQVLNTNSPLPYGSAVALFTYLIDTVLINGKYQVKAAPEYILDAGQAIKQQMDKETKGGIYELALGYGRNYEDKWLQQ